MKDVQVLWCGNNPKSNKNGWAFPSAVRKLLIEECEGLSVLHLFGGRADFGVRLDVDETTRPDVVGDAWLPPFAADSFDVVIMDPPYVGGFATLCNEKVIALFAAAAWIARKRVIWFHTLWIESPARCKYEKGWLVRVGRHCNVRCLEFFAPPPRNRKLSPFTYFTRGPAIKYNKWLQQPQGLPFGDDVK